MKHEPSQPNERLSDEAFQRLSAAIAAAPSAARLLSKIDAALVLESVPNAMLDACRRASSSAVLQRELLRRALARSEANFNRTSECLENISRKVVSLRDQLSYLDAALEMGEVR